MFIFVNGGFLTAAGRGEGAGKKFWKLEVWAEATGAEACGGPVTRGVGRFLAGGSVNVVITTFITHKSNRGHWTSAVQGPKFFKLFFWRQVVGWQGFVATRWLLAAGEQHAVQAFYQAGLIFAGEGVFPDTQDAPAVLAEGAAD